LNLWKANEFNFLDAGIKKENIAVTNVCTCCNPDVLFSHRITGFNRGNLSAFLSLKA
jgi:copper oxidase (laccase) domain-containing protein